MVKRWVEIIAASILFFFAAGRVDAAEYDHSLEGSLKYFYFDYKEINEPDTHKSKESGLLPGIRIGYGYQGVANPLYGRLFLEYIRGDSDYDGATQIGVPFKADTKNKFWNWEGNIGLTRKHRIEEFPVDLTLYTGLGYRYWNRGLGGANPYSEEYTWKFVPVGLRGAFPITAKWSGAIDVALWFMFAGDIQVNLSEANSNYNNPRKDLGNKLGWKIEAPFNYRLYDRWSMEVIPYYENYAFGHSDIFQITFGGAPFGFGFEPDSRTNQYGLRLGARFHF